jgi:hypothetical protein
LSPDHPKLAPAGCPEEWTLSLFVEGQLPEAEHRAVWRHVQTCETCEELVGVTAHWLDERDSPAVAPGGLSERARHPAARSTGWSRLRRWRGPATGLAATLVLGALVYQRGRDATHLDLPARQILGHAQGRPLPLPPGWPDHAWAATRGAEVAFSARAVAFRAGAWIVDLESALSASDQGSALTAAASLRSLLTPVDRSEPALLFYEELQQRLRRSPPDLAGAAATAAEAEGYLGRTSGIDRDAFLLGKWIEASRLAARAGDGAFLAALPADELSRGPAASDERLQASLAAVARLRHDGLAEAEIPELLKHLDRMVQLAGGE